MGCGQSKIENEEVVNRCKDRKIFMKEAVSGRNAFAAAHFAYAAAIKNTGAALSDYAQGEVQFTDGSSSGLASAGGATLLPPPPQPPYDPLLPPPPPPYDTPLQRAASMPEFSIPKPDFKPEPDPIIEEVNEEDEIENESRHGLRHRSSSRSSGGGGSRAGASETENLPPPPSPQMDDRTPPPPPPENTLCEYFFPDMENVPGSSLADVEESRIERERKERSVLEEKERVKRSEIDDSGERSSKVEPEVFVEAAREPTVELPPTVPTAKQVKKVRNSAPPVAEGKRSGKGVQNVNLLQIFNELDDCFLKASESAHEVSKMLEANRLHYHSNFADNRGHIDHSARVMRVIMWNRSFKGLPTSEDVKDDFDSEENETHAAVLDKMLAWEKKLYDEVKAGELMKFDYQKKVAHLNKLKKRGSSTESLERTKAAVSHLHTRYIVDMQSMDSTVSEINRLRDEQLYPKLVQLVDGMATMWESMRIHHEQQSKIAQLLRSLEITHSPKGTSEHHHNNTVQLLVHIKQWNAQFNNVLAHQKEYIKALNNWLKLNLIPIDNNLREKVSSPQRPQNPPIQHLLRDWNDCLEKLPVESTKSAIFNFAAVVETICQYQADEMKMRDACEKTRKELTKNTRMFEDWYKKHMQKWTPPDEMDGERAHENDLIAERQVVVETLKRRLEEEEEAYQRQCIQVRDKSLTNLKTGLPEVFRSMAEFSRTCSYMYKSLKSHTTKPINVNGSL